MNFRSLIHKNITYFTRYYKLVATAVLITITVIVGSLVVGDSVRRTLANRVTERLGDTETILFSRNSYMADNLLETPLLNSSARGILLVNGFISQNGKLIPVFVYGVDDMSVSRGTARINPSLAKELTPSGLNDLVLRLPAAGLVPSGSLFVTENYTTSLRLSYDGIVEVKDGGNISMKNEQILPFNIFVNRQELAEALDVEGKVNLILDTKHLSAADFSTVWNYASSGLTVNQEEEFTEIISDRVFLQQEAIESIRKNNQAPNQLFSYLANAIEFKGTSIPYSFVTAMERYKEDTLQKDEVILSDYSANRLNAKVGDVVDIAYFTSHDLKTLLTKSIQLRVKKIVPLAELVADKTLSANFPGLSDVERCTDWDSDLPIDMDLITGEDERYWDIYRSTPKAIIAYEAIADDWSNAYGNATAIRVTNSEPDLSELRAEMFGIQLLYPREAGLYAALNGVDFSSLFLALGFFIIVSAILLMLIPLSEMLYQRRKEIELLQALGYPRKRILKMLWMESAPVVLLSSVVGVLAGLLYTGLIMWLLGNVWEGATQTDGFSIYPNILTIAVGLVIGAGLSLWLLRRTIVRSLKEKQQKNQPKKITIQTRKFAVVLSTVLAVIIIVVNFFYLHSVILFILVGVLLIGMAALWGDYLICRNGMTSITQFRFPKLVWSSLYANKKQALLSFFALSIGVFIVFSVGLNRRGFADSSQIRTGTGGYSIWAESTVPVYHNIMTEEGRSRLALSDLPADTDILQALRYSADDASCLNLNKVSTPTVLGIDMTSFEKSDFQIEQSLYPMDRTTFFTQMQVHSDSVYPVFVDATVLTWGLIMNLGDTLYYEAGNGQTVALQMVGTLSNSIFQGNILMDRNLFKEIWPEITGSEVFLFKVDESERDAVKNLLSQALSEYGVTVSTTNDRLKQFNVVTDTYLTIFLTLGGLGLLLGIMSFIIVIRKNLAMRRKEIELYGMLGFTAHKIEQILYQENILVPLYAIATGVISALLGVSLSFMNTGLWIWFIALLFTVFFVVCVIVFVRKSVKKEVQGSERCSNI
ncbi:ABC transporter permease [Parabacteroides sp. OttesenSCG-928-G07]|nr:ABC transporter permease [Parabacteroides sp. OttesenSCG-928-G07]